MNRAARRGAGEIPEIDAAATRHLPSALLCIDKMQGRASSAAAGPGIRTADLPEGASIVQLPATLLALAGLAAPGMDGEPLHAVLDRDEPAEVAVDTPADRGAESAYSAEEEAEIVERLRDLGYE